MNKLWGLSLIILILGCTNQGSNITLNKNSADPLTTLAIKMNNINLNADETLARFYNNAYDVTVPALDIINDTIIASVPAYVSNDEYTSGIVSVQVIQVNNGARTSSQAINDFTINNLPETNAQAGSITLKSFIGIINATVLVSTEANETKYDNNETAIAMLTNLLITTLMYSGINNTISEGTELYFGTINNQTLMINEKSLHNTDRLLLALYKAQAGVIKREEGVVKFALEDEPGCMAKEAKSLTEVIESGDPAAYYTGYYGAPIKSINCKTAEAFTDGMKVIAGSSGVAMGLLGLAGASSSLVSAALLYVNTQLGGGLILLGGMLGQETPGASSLVAEGYNQLTQAGQILQETVTSNIELDDEFTTKLPPPFQDLKDIWTNLNELHDTLTKQEGVEEKYVRLTVYRDGNSYGIINTDKAGLTGWGHCTHKCTVLFRKGAEIILKEIPDELEFNGWTGDCTGTKDCSLKMDKDMTIHATWAQDTVYLTVNRLGDAYGGFNVDKGIIESDYETCTTSCTALIKKGTIITITASDYESAKFTAWTGDCTGTGDCVLNMTEDKTVNELFNQDNVTLTVNRLGDYGSFNINVGVISSDYSTCTNVCTATLSKGTEVTLTVIPTEGAAFTGWTGDCTGTGDCTLIMDSDKTVNENFATSQTQTPTQGTGALTVAMTSQFSTSVKATGSWGTECNYVLTTSGTASGPEGAKVHVYAGGGEANYAFNGWTQGSIGYLAQRMTGESESVSWTSSYSFTCIIGDYPIEVYATVSLIGPTGAYSSETTSKKYYDCNC